MDGFISSKFSYEDLDSLRDENGFIDISKTDVKLDKSSREQRGTKTRIKNWIDFNGTKVLLRGQVVPNYSCYAELITEEIAEELGIETAEYDLIKIKKSDDEDYTYGVLSKSILDFDKEMLFTLYDLIGDDPEESLEKDVDFVDKMKYDFTEEALRERFEKAGYDPEYIDSIITEYKKRLIFYLSVVETDKHAENIAFLKSKDGLDRFRFAPNFDSEFSLLLESPSDLSDYIIENVDNETDIQDPKIGVKVPRKDSGFESIWKDTLERLIEDDEIYNYAQDIIGKINMDEVFEKVERKIHAKLPIEVKQIAKGAYNSRNNKMREIVLGEYDYEDLDDSKRDLFAEELLKSILGESIKKNITLSEVGEGEKKLDPNLEHFKNDRDKNQEEKE